MSRQYEQLIFAALALILRKLRSASIQADQESIDMVKRLEDIGDSSEHRHWNVEVAAEIVDRTTRRDSIGE